MSVLCTSIRLLYSSIHRVVSGSGFLRHRAGEVPTLNTLGLCPLGKS